MATSFSYDVFLSYNHNDKQRVRRLAERLRDANVRVWFDHWNVKAGEIISLKIDEGLEQSRVLVLCISPNALASNWVALERSTAIHRDPSNDSRRFIPLILADCDLPDTLRRYKHIDFTEETDTAFAELLTACRIETAPTRLIRDYNDPPNRSPYRPPYRLLKRPPNDTANLPTLNYLDSISKTLGGNDLTHRSASASRRIVCALLDLIYSALLSSPIAGAMYLTGSNLRDPQVIGVLAGSVIMVAFLYLTLLTALTGRTWAMRLLSLRVIDTKTGLIPTGGQSIGRSFFYLLSLATVVGILYALASREGYTIHDRFTHTAVVSC